MKKSSEVRTLNRRYQSYKAEYMKLFGSGYQGMKKLDKESFTYYVKAQEGFGGVKRFTKKMFREMILNSREETVKQLNAAYDNLKAYYDKHKGDLTDPVIQLCKEYSFPGILTKDQWLREGGGNLYVALRNAGLADEALGS